MKAKRKLLHKVMKQMDKKWIVTNPKKNYTPHACACVCVCACFHFWWNKSKSMLRNFCKRDTKLKLPLIESSCECSNMNPARKTRTSSSSSFPFLMRDKRNQMRVHCWSFNLQQPKNNKNLNRQFNLFDMKAWSSLPKFTIMPKTPENIQESINLLLPRFTMLQEKKT